MKKLLACALCLALAGSAVLGSCGKEEKKEKKEKETEIVEVVEEVVEYEVPEEQLDFEFEIDTFDMVAKITGYIGEKTQVVIPDTITDPVYGDVVPVATIGTYAFAENENIEVVVLPETVTEIEKGAFQSCPNLRAVSLPFGLETIGVNAFYNSNKIDKLGMVIGNEPTEEQLAALNPVEEEAVEEVTEEPVAEEAVAEVAEEPVAEEAAAEVAEVAEEEPAAEETAEEAEVEEVEEVDLYSLIGNEFPVTVSEIGFMAFSSQLNEIAWYSALEGDVVVVGDGVLLKFKANADYTLDESIKSVAYYAFSNVGPVKVTVTNPEITFDANAIFMSDKALTFVLPEGAEELAATIKSCGGAYEFPVVEEEAAEGEEAEAEGEEATEETAA